MWFILIAYCSNLKHSGSQEPRSVADMKPGWPGVRERPGRCRTLFFGAVVPHTGFRHFD